MRGMRWDWPANFLRWRPDLPVISRPDADWSAWQRCRLAHGQCEMEPLLDHWEHCSNCCWLAVRLAVPLPRKVRRGLRPVTLHKSTFCSFKNLVMDLTTKTVVKFRL